MKEVIRTCLDRPVGTISLAVAVALAGLGAIGTSSISLLPQVDVPVVSVRAEYTGLPAGEMREIVTIPLERGLSGLTGLRRTESTTRAGIVSVRLWFDWDVSSVEAASSTREAVDTLYPTLPNAVRRPSVRRTDPTAAPAIRLALHPRELSPARARRLAEREIRSALQQLDGVGAVVVSGGEIEEVHVRIDHDRAGELGIDTPAVRSALTESNLEYAAGSLFDGDLELSVTTDARVSSPAQLGAIYLPSPGRSGEANIHGDNADNAGALGPVPVSAVASVEYGHAPRRSVFLLDGEEAIGIDVYPLPGSSPAEVAGRVRELLFELRSTFGSSVDFEIAHDRSRPIRSALSELAFAALLGMSAAVIVLVISLREVRSAVIVAVSIPVSGAFAFAAMAVAGVNLNIMSLAGLAVGIGMVVDNSIVVVENLSERRVDPHVVEEIADGVHEVAGATLAGTLTTVAVFVPLFAFRGIAGRLYGDLATAVIAALVASYITSVSVTPVLFRWIGSRRPEHAAAPLAATPAASVGRPPAAPRWFRAVLKRSLRHRAVTLALPVALIAFGGLMARSVTPALSESVDEGEIQMQLSFPADRSIEAVTRDTARFIGSFSDDEGVASVVAQVGGEPDDPRFLADHGRSVNSAELTVLPAAGVSARDLASRLNSHRLPHLATGHAQLPEGELSRLLRFGGTSGLAVYGDSPELAAARAARIAAEIEESDGSVEITPAGRRSSISAVPDRKLLDHRRISLSEASVTLRSAVEGIAAGRLLRDGEEIDIRLLSGDVESADDIRDMHMPAASDGPGTVRLGEILRIEERDGPAVLARRGRRDALFLHAAGEGDGLFGAVPSSGSETAAWVEDTAGDAISEQAEAFAPVFALAVLIVASILATQFEGFLEPAIVLGVLPAAFIGAVAALGIAGREFTVQSALGALVLIGIVVNSAIVLIDTWKRDADPSRGSRLSTAVIVYRGALRRLRPIAMTTATTMAAMLPLAVDPGIRSHQSALAIALIGGLLTGTVVTLFIVPALYLGARRRWPGG